jgi:hypothetical protein
MSLWKLYREYLLNTHILWKETCDLVGYYAALSGSSVPTFRDNLSVISSRVKKSKYTWIGCPETSVQNYHLTLRTNIPKGRRLHQHRGGSLNSCTFGNIKQRCLVRYRHSLTPIDFASKATYSKRNDDNCLFSWTFVCAPPVWRLPVQLNFRLGATSVETACSVEPLCLRVRSVLI